MASDPVNAVDKAGLLCSNEAWLWFGYALQAEFSQWGSLIAGEIPDTYSTGLRYRRIQPWADSFQLQIPWLTTLRSRSRCQAEGILVVERLDMLSSGQVSGQLLTASPC